MLFRSQSYFPPERTKKILGRFKGIGGNTMAALLGTVTPFCSCSSIPLFIGFSSAGLPVGLTFSFLISSPLVDMASMVLIMSIFGAKVAVAYVVMGLVLAVAGGTLIEKLGMEKYLEDYIKKAAATEIETPNLSRRERHEFAYEQTSSIVGRVYIYVLLGVGIGAVIHNWIPTEWSSLCFRRQQSICRGAGCRRRHPHVLRYLRRHPHCRGAAPQRG